MFSVAIARADLLRDALSADLAIQLQCESDQESFLAGEDTRNGSVDA